MLRAATSGSLVACRAPRARRQEAGKRAADCGHPGTDLIEAPPVRGAQCFFEDSLPGWALSAPNNTARGDMAPGPPAPRFMARSVLQSLLHVTQCKHQYIFILFQFSVSAAAAACAVSPG